jgi:hypothetical protein
MKYWLLESIGVCDTKAILDSGATSIERGAVVLVSSSFIPYFSPRKYRRITNRANKSHFVRRNARCTLRPCDCCNRDMLRSHVPGAHCLHRTSTTVRAKQSKRNAEANQQKACRSCRFDEGPEALRAHFLYLGIHLYTNSRHFVWHCQCSEHVLVLHASSQAICRGNWMTENYWFRAGGERSQLTRGMCQ